MIEEFEVSESSASSFDVKKFIFRALSYWKWFLLLLAIGVFFVYQKNIREEFSYRLSTKISIEDDSNPLFTSTQSLNFNWGGVTAKVQTMIVVLGFQLLPFCDKILTKKIYLINKAIKKGINPMAKTCTPIIQ